MAATFQGTGVHGARTPPSRAYGAGLPKRLTWAPGALAGVPSWLAAWAPCAEALRREPWVTGAQEGWLGGEGCQHAAPGQARDLGPPLTGILVQKGITGR